MEVGASHTAVAFRRRIQALGARHRTPSTQPSFLNPELIKGTLSQKLTHWENRDIKYVASIGAQSHTTDHRLISLDLDIPINVRLVPSSDHNRVDHTVSRQRQDVQIAIYPNFGDWRGLVQWQFDFWNEKIIGVYFSQNVVVCDGVEKWSLGRVGTTGDDWTLLKGEFLSNLDLVCDDIEVVEGKRWAQIAPTPDHEGIWTYGGAVDEVGGTFFVSVICDVRGFWCEVNESDFRRIILIDKNQSAVVGGEAQGVDF